jgi:dihydroxyacetone kinase
MKYSCTDNELKHAVTLVFVVLFLTDFLNLCNTTQRDESHQISCEKEFTNTDMIVVRDSRYTSMSYIDNLSLNTLVISLISHGS